MSGKRNCKLGAWGRGMVAGLAMVTGLLGSTALAGEGFATLAGIPAQALSQSAMAAVEGKATPLEALFLAYLRGNATNLGQAGALGSFQRSLLCSIQGAQLCNIVRSPVFPRPSPTPAQAIQLLITPASPLVIADLQRQLRGH